MTGWNHCGINCEFFRTWGFFWPLFLKVESFDIKYLCSFIATTVPAISTGYFSWFVKLRIKFDTKILKNHYQAYVGRRRPHRPGLPNSLFPPWDFCFAIQKLVHQQRRPWMKTRASATTLGTGTRASKIQDGEDADVLGSPDPTSELISKIHFFIVKKNLALRKHSRAINLK